MEVLVLFVVVYLGAVVAGNLVGLFPGALLVVGYVFVMDPGFLLGGAVAAGAVIGGALRESSPR